ncbi:hypothetical protein Cabther_A1594 [Chloracidobacterium thermophilum B]|uniref:Uncharacterized protein n=2 Tax=Acidobacteriaceae TaxID=204434 RepID=G2LJ57_CHLTF|nr:hypothetical protein Cabther_A1594 [Chloracidobacterium thermophilum B]
MRFKLASGQGHLTAPPDAFTLVMTYHTSAQRCGSFGDATGQEKLPEEGQSNAGRDGIRMEVGNHPLGCRIACCAMYDRVIRLRGSETYELATRTRFGYELDPSRNFGIRLVVRAYVVAEDYSIEDFAAMVRNEAARREETQRFRAAFALDSRDLDAPYPESHPEPEPPPTTPPADLPPKP